MKEKEKGQGEWEWEWEGEKHKNETTRMKNVLATASSHTANYE